jgi:hypothetical protein
VHNPLCYCVGAAGAGNVVAGRAAGGGATGVGGVIVGPGGCLLAFKSKIVICRLIPFSGFPAVIWILLSGLIEVLRFGGYAPNLFFRVCLNSSAT